MHHLPGTTLCYARYVVYDFGVYIIEQYPCTYNWSPYLRFCCSYST